MRSLVVSIAVSAAALLIIFLTVLSPARSGHGYELSVGWNAPAGSSAVCDRPLAKHGYPFAETRPYPDSCADSDNRLAFILNNAIYIAAWVMLFTGLAAVFIALKGKTHASK